MSMKAAVCGQGREKKNTKQKLKKSTIPLFLISLVPLSLKKIRGLMALAAPMCSSTNQCAPPTASQILTHGCQDSPVRLPKITMVITPIRIVAFLMLNVCLQTHTAII